MRRVTLSLALALTLPAAALAGPALPSQVVIEARVQDLVQIDFARALGFKLPCPHTVSIDVADPSVLQPVNVPAETKKPRFEFEVAGFGTTLVTATFAGITCTGGATAQVEATLRPILSDEIKFFGKAAKELAKQGKALKREEIEFLEERMRLVVDDFDDGFISLNDAAADLFGLAMSSLAFVAAELGGQQMGLASLGGSLLQSAGALSIPPPLMTGAKGSLWDGAQGANSACYREFVAEVRELLCDALDALAEIDDGGLRSVVSLGKRFPLRLSGPRLLDDPDDDFASPAAWLGFLAYASASGSGILGTGVSQVNGGSTANVRAFGPGGVFELLVEPKVTDARQNLLILITPRIVRDPVTVLGVGPALVPAPGNWRFELSDEDDEHPSDIFFITSP